MQTPARDHHAPPSPLVTSSLALARGQRLQSVPFSHNPWFCTGTPWGNGGLVTAPGVSCPFNPSTFTLHLLSDPSWAGPAPLRPHLTPPNRALCLAVGGTTVALPTREHQGRRPWEHPGDQAQGRALGARSWLVILLQTTDRTQGGVEKGDVPLGELAQARETTPQTTQKSRKPAHQHRTAVDGKAIGRAARMSASWWRLREGPEFRTDSGCLCRQSLGRILKDKV